MVSIHLLVVIHGMWGNPEHVAELARVVRDTHDGIVDGVELKVLLAEKNKEDSTYDGIDWGGERVAQEVMDEVEKLKGDGKAVTRFSVAGYSLGGLVARYLVGILDQQGFFKTVVPVNFNTVATPHLGLPKYPRVFSLLSAALGPKLLSRTGEQFYCADKWATSGKPLLEVMADPDRIFYKALLKFSHITIYANAINDMTVPYITSAIEVEDPFTDYDVKGLEIEFQETYEPLIKSYTVPPSPPVKPSILSAKWFKSLTPDRPLLPPAFQLRFPLNVVIYMLLPILVPVGISLGLIRLSLASRASRARIKSLEEDASNGQKLIHAISAVEQRVEDAVVELVEDPTRESNTDSSALALAMANVTSTEDNREGLKNASICQGMLQPLTTLQRQIAAWLNTLPQLRKEKAFIPRVRNSHAVIVCRDVTRFPGHRMGEGVIRHLADHFVL